MGMKTLAWMATAWLGLAGLQLVVGTGSGQVAGLLASVTKTVNKALSLSQ